MLLLNRIIMDNNEKFKIVIVAASFIFLIYLGFHIVNT